MLNELYDLAQCLKSAQVSLASWHPRFVPCPKSKPTYFALLDADARVGALERVSEHERIAAIRTWKRPENGVSFPSFNIPPLYRPRSEEAKISARELRHSLASQSPPNRDTLAFTLETLLGNSDSLWVATKAAQLNKSVGIHAEELAAILGTPPSECSAIVELIARAQRLTPATLHHQLTEVVRNCILRMSESAQEWFDILIFHSGSKPKDVSLILEVAERSDFEYPANHKHVQEWVNAAIQAKAAASSTSHPATPALASDVFGNPRSNAGDKFPAARMPRLGNVILRSMAKDSRCQRRYGRAESDSCSVGQASRNEMKNALEWIGSADRQDRTWSDISSLTGKASVLFAYPSNHPENVPELAGLIVGLDWEADPDGANFEACASRVASALKGQARNIASTEIAIFVLTKADTARTKVMQSRCFSAVHLLNSAREWEEGARNVPPMRIGCFTSKDKEKPFWKKPLTPFPAEVVICLNTNWEGLGTHPESVSGFDVGDGLGLLLEQSWKLRNVAVRALHALLANSVGLLLAMGHAHHHGRVHGVDKNRTKHPLLLPSILGLVLAKLGRGKGDYMKGASFLVGRLLSLADQLHVRYCHGVRKGQVPTQLVGNALMGTALEQPTKALAVLSQRILPYQAWATTVQDGENVGLTKYLLGEMGRVAAELAKFDLPLKSTDTEKAEMLLGYLAHAGKTSDPESDNGTTAEGANT